MPTPRFIRALAAQETAERPATLVTFSHAAFSEPIRITDCATPITTTAPALLLEGETEAVFTPVAMQAVELPGEGADATARRSRLLIDNTDREVQAKFAFAQDEIECRLDLVLADAPDDIQESWPRLRVTEYSPAGGMMTVALAPRDDSAEVWPYQTFAPGRTPGLFS
ncbi:MAG TPA: DUF1833 family protein [Terricaulis sp.]|nr:DUF1833 family protein [Terricaulis sp.]